MEQPKRPIAGKVVGMVGVSGLFSPSGGLSSGVGWRGKLSSFGTPSPFVSPLFSFESFVSFVSVSCFSSSSSSSEEDKELLMRTLSTVGVNSAEIGGVGLDAAPLVSSVFILSGVWGAAASSILTRLDEAAERLAAFCWPINFRSSCWTFLGFKPLFSNADLISLAAA